MFEGQRLLRLAPDGRVLRELPLPVRCPTMPCFGGADLRTLYVTTARENRPADELAAQPLAGCVLSCAWTCRACPSTFACLMSTLRGAPLERPRSGRRHATPAWDLAIVGGGATGLGVALDAAARGLSVVLVEAEDFAKGTSSRATKLLHGGVRYLAQGNVGLVREALHERSALLANAPHLASRLPFVMPGYRWWESGFYGMGLKAYDLLAGRARSVTPSSSAPHARRPCCPCAPRA
jgi:hypothetical protein